MKLTQLIIAEEKSILTAFENTFDMQVIITNDSFSLYTGTKDSLDTETEILFLSSLNLKKSFKYIIEHYDVFKIVVAGTAQNLSNIDIVDNDVVLPNSFISTT
jgi:hypothetical protein